MSEFVEAMNLLGEKVQEIAPFGKRVKFVLDDNIAMLNGHTTPPSIEFTDGDAEIVMKASLVNFKKLLSKELQATMAFMSGKIKVEGDLKAALPLMKVF